jgi:uncharacterized membrane protein
MAQCVGLALFGAGVSKLARPSQFREELADYALLPSVAVSPAGILIVLLELAAGLAAIVPSTRTIGCGVAIALLAAFTSAVLVNIARGRTEIACACFGRSSQRLSWQIPARNAVLIAAAAIGMTSTDALLPTMGGAVVLALALLVSWLVVEYMTLVSPREVVR